MVAAAQVAAGQVPGVLPAPTPHGELAGDGQRVRAPDRPAAAIAADYAVFEEAVDAAARRLPAWRARPAAGKTRRATLVPMTPAPPARLGAERPMLAGSPGNCGRRPVFHSPRRAVFSARLSWWTVVMVRALRRL